MKVYNVSENCEYLQTCISREAAERFITKTLKEYEEMGLGNLCTREDYSIDEEEVFE